MSGYYPGGGVGMARYYTLIQDGDRTVGDTVGSVTDDLHLTPAERATLLAAGTVRIDDLIMEPLIIQIEPEPEDYTFVEIVFVNDYGATRWTNDGGTVQL